jgi:hypothetical protein
MQSRPSIGPWRSSLIMLTPSTIEATPLLFARRLDEALAAFERVIKMKPLYALASYGRGQAFLELKRFVKRWQILIMRSD